jgi:hypothetical protein
MPHRSGCGIPSSYFPICRTVLDSTGLAVGLVYGFIASPPLAMRPGAGPPGASYRVEAGATDQPRRPTLTALTSTLHGCPLWKIGEPSAFMAHRIRPTRTSCLAGGTSPIVKLVAQRPWPGGRRQRAWEF